MLYFDHSATTPLHPTVLKLLTSVSTEHFGNPSSIHKTGQKSRVIVENARKQVANAIGCSTHEIIFTGGGSESNNLVLWNLLSQKKKHVITSTIEHPSISKTLQRLKEFGVTVTKVPVNGKGRVNPEDVMKAINTETGLITVMFANNEVGTVQPIEEIVAIAQKYGITFHSDGVQVPGKIPININELGVGMMSFSAHKFYGPKGVGALYIEKGNKIRSLITGGGQERNLRAGTENVPGIAAMGLAAELAANEISVRQTHLSDLSKYFSNEIKNIYPEIIFNGDPDNMLPGVINVSFPSLTSDVLLFRLNQKNIAVSSGSACSSGTVKPSEILKAMNISNKMNIRTLRISFGRDNKIDDVKILVESLREILADKR